MDIPAPIFRLSVTILSTSLPQHSCEGFPCVSTRPGVSGGEGPGLICLLSHYTIAGRVSRQQKRRLLNEHTTETRGEERERRKAIGDTGSYQAGRREGWKGAILRPREKPEAARSSEAAGRGSRVGGRAAQGQELPGDS